MRENLANYELEAKQLQQFFFSFCGKFRVAVNFKFFYFKTRLNAVSPLRYWFNVQVMLADLSGALWPL